MLNAIIAIIDKGEVGNYNILIIIINLLWGKRPTKLETFNKNIRLVPVERFKMSPTATKQNLPQRTVLLE